MVISFGRCDHIAAVVEIGVAVCGNINGDHSTIWMLSHGCSPLPLLIQLQTASAHSFFTFAKV